MKKVFLLFTFFLLGFTMYLQSQPQYTVILRMGRVYQTEHEGWAIGSAQPCYADIFDSNWNLISPSANYTYI